MMSLGQKQRLFTRMLSRLLNYAHGIGYEITLGDAYRDPRVFGELGKSKGYGSPNSCHKSRLAIDLNLFLDGCYLTTTEDYAKLGEKWESLGGTWGGRFSQPDGNHFSLEHDGHK